MDQRNAGGQSRAPITAQDGWDTYTGDHLALLDHLRIERCHLYGQCIGGSFILNLLKTQPERGRRGAGPAHRARRTHACRAVREIAVARRRYYRAWRYDQPISRAAAIAYAPGEWAFHDNYFGGEPYGGRSVVFRQGKPVWMAVYYGRVDGPPAEIQPVYSFLQRASGRP